MHREGRAEAPPLPPFPYMGKQIMKRILPILLVILMLILGLGLLFYPDVASWLSARDQAGAVLVYNDEIAQMRAEYIEDHFRRAEEYNQALNGGYIEDPFVQGSGAVLPPAYYLETLNIRGMMGRIEIPRLDIDLPIFHTVFPDVLNRGVGHIEGTSFPIGGTGTHAVLTAHSGLANATMFTPLLPSHGGIEYGDIFVISVLDRRLAYEVDSIISVLPHEIETLRIDQTADYVTLVTCTPFAINSHRLFVRGFRVPYEPEVIAEIEVDLPSPIDWRMLIVVGFVILFLLAILIYKIVSYRRELQRERAFLQKLEREWSRKL